VSSKEQEKEGFSIPAQLKLLKEYAATQGFNVWQEYLDVETAKQTGRAGFGEMVAYLKAHPSVRVLLVEKTDRLYRNLKDWVTIDELGVELHFPKEGVVLSRESRSSEKFMHGPPGNLAGRSTRPIGSSSIPAAARAVSVWRTTVRVMQIQNCFG
jgi:site-specific DNA recombinase